MKKIIAAVIFLTLMLTLSACVKAENESQAMPNESIVSESDGEKEIVSKADFVGEWYGLRPYIIITEGKNDTLDVTIHWGSSAWESTEWTYSCTFNEVDGTLVCENGGTRTDTVFSREDENAAPEITVMYDDGSAVFSINDDGKLIWSDAKEDAGKDFFFEKQEQ